MNPITGEDTRKGFLIGTVNEPGVCEACGKKLRVGSRAAIWHPTRELFCLFCLETVWVDPEGFRAETIIIPLLLIGALMASVMLNIVP